MNPQIPPSLLNPALIQQLCKLLILQVVAVPLNRGVDCSGELEDISTDLKISDDIAVLLGLILGG